ncbi:transmembrane transport protein MmpL11 [Mycobacterium tuberculosis variant bovis BCG]|nr:transmembrane transport protein MmpL11 [Mycobacterium tuberculosis variant bovis BCG]
MPLVGLHGLVAGVSAGGLPGDDAVGNLTGGGFEVAGSQSLLVHDQLDAHYPDRGAPALALVAAPDRMLATKTSTMPSRYCDK